MKPRTKKILNFALIFGTLAIVLLVGFRGQDIHSILAAIGQMSLSGLLGCVLLFIGNFLFDGLSLWYFLHRQGYSVRLWFTVYISILGIYYSSITPGASGGQPMQVYYMNKADIPVGVGTSALTIKFFCFQFMLTLLTTIGWIANGRFAMGQVDGNRWILIFGFIYNAFIVTLVLLMAINKKLISFFLHKLVWLLAHIRLVKDPIRTETRVMDVLDTFHGSVMMLAKKPIDLVVQLVIGGCQLMCQMAVILAVYHGFGLNGSSSGQILTMSLMEYISAAYTPLPGGSGAQEGVFILYFQGIFDGSYAIVALLLWRFFTYYLNMIVGAIVTVYRGFRPCTYKARRHGEAIPKPGEASAAPKE